MRRKPLTDDEIEEAADRAEGKKPDPEARRAGRPPKYQASFSEQAKKLCDLGATNVDLADFFGVNIRTVDRWLAEHEEFCRAVNETRAFSDERVERRLYERAMGYAFDSEKVMAVKGEVVRVPTREHVPPDVTAMIFWLKNRRPKDWRDKRELSGPDGGPIQTETRLDLSGLSEDERSVLRAMLSRRVEEPAGGSD